CTVTGSSKSGASGDSGSRAVAARSSSSSTYTSCCARLPGAVLCTSSHNVSAEPSTSSQVCRYVSRCSPALWCAECSELSCVRRRLRGAPRHPVAPRHVPAVELVVGGDRLVGGVLDDHDVADQRVVVEPLGVRGALCALHVREPDTAMAGALAAEGRIAMLTR